MKFVLLVTWIVSGQPPSSYQATFSSREMCQAARDAVLLDGERFRRDMSENARKAGISPNMALMAAPAVTAVCAAQ